jgi:hypothetical protein
VQRHLGSRPRRARHRFCDTIRIDPVRKQIAEDRVTWSIRMRRGTSIVEGRADAEIGSRGVSNLRFGPN